MKENILTLVFIVVYLLVFCFVIDLIFRNTLSIYSDLLAIPVG